MKKRRLDSSSRKHLKKLVEDSAGRLSDLGLDSVGAPSEEQLRAEREKVERRKLLKEVQKKIEGLSS
jgi:hypothetical protein